MPRFTQREGPGAPLPPTFVYLAGFLAAWFLHREFPSPVNEGVGPVQAVVGAIGIAIGLAIFVWGLLTFYRLRTGIMLQKPAVSLVEEGPYRWSRNPQYVAFNAIYVGAALLANTVWPLVLLPVVVGTILIAVISREERYLRSTFGPAYDDYCRRVKRWI